jgi:5-formyltetrahydrofolate cyclo-ligase
MDGIADKNAMRREFRQKRDVYVESLSPRDMTLSFSAAPTVLKSLFTRHKIVAGYMPIGSEANPGKILAIARAAQCIIALPYVVSKLAPMRFLIWNKGDTLCPGPFGLLQPHTENRVVIPDIALVPLIAFDRQCNRLGQGAGHYDRALSILDDVTAVGISWSAQEAPHIPADPWDIPLNAILTEKEWISK